MLAGFEGRREDRLTRLDGFRIEFFARRLDGGDLKDLIDREVCSMLRPGGDLLVWATGEQAPELGSCTRCEPDACWKAPSIRQVCRICANCDCRASGHHGRGAWGKALLRPHVLRGVEETSSGTLLTLDGFTVEMDPTLVGEGDISDLKGKTAVGLLYLDGVVRYVEYDPPEPEILSAFLGSLGG